MKRTLLSVGLLFALFSCEKKIEVVPDSMSTSALSKINDISVMREEPGGGGCVIPQSTELITLPDDNGNEQVKGSLSISNDNDFVYVTLNTLDAETRIGSIQLFYGTAAEMKDLNQYPDDPSVGINNPQINVEPETVVSTYTIQIPMSSLNTSCLRYNVHASFYTSNPFAREIEVPVWVKPIDPSFQVMQYPWSANIEYCTQSCPKPSCGQLRTQTPGGWGTMPHGNNPGSYLHANFANAFPNGLNIGCSPDFNLQFNNALAISNFLPSGGKASVLTKSYVNPVGLKNVLAGHLVALTLSVGFDQVDNAFGAAGISLSEMKIKSGAFAGWKVGDFLNEAKQVFGGCSKRYSVQQVLETASSINENYVDGNTDKGYLVCPN